MLHHRHHMVEETARWPTAMFLSGFQCGEDFEVMPRAPELLAALGRWRYALRT